jgi:hypothetical protein
MFNKKIFSLGALLVSGFVNIAMAEGIHYIYEGRQTHYIDFSAKSTFTNHQSWPTWTPATGAGATKYLTLEFQGDPNGSCYSVGFAPGSGTTNTYSDLQLWTEESTRRSIDDNGPNTTLPYAKVKVNGGSWIRVSGKNSNFNNIDFKMLVSQIPLSQCNDDGVTPLWDMTTNTPYHFNSLVN